MIQLRRSQERGHFHYGWLETYHTFSFGQYLDPAAMGFRTLRVINEDWIAPGGGFPPHPHRDMEIVTYVISGALEHQDSTGEQGIVRPHTVQRMSAGRGIVHSERNPSLQEPVHLLQVWFLPKQRGLEPEYELREFSPEARQGRWRLLVSPDGAAGAVRIHQQVRLWDLALEDGPVARTLDPTKGYWLQVVTGTVSVDGATLSAGDAAAFEGEERLLVHGETGSVLVLFELE